jgi:uncharacterized protein YpmB
VNHIITTHSLEDVIEVYVGLETEEVILNVINNHRSGRYTYCLYEFMSRKQHGKIKNAIETYIKQKSPSVS